MKLDADLAIDFYQQDEVSVFLETSVSGDREKFAEILTFAMFALRQMYCLGPSDVTNGLAELLASAAIGVEGWASGVSDNTVRLVAYPGSKGRRGFACQLRFSDDSLRFDMQPRGFGLLSQGVGYYSPAAVTAFLKYLVLRRRQDAQYLDRLASAAVMCGQVCIDGHLEMSNQARWGMLISVSTAGDYLEKNVQPLGPTDQTVDVETCGVEESCPNSACANGPLLQQDNNGITWLRCSGCSGEVGIPSQRSQCGAKCPNCGTPITRTVSEEASQQSSPPPRTFSTAASRPRGQPHIRVSGRPSLQPNGYATTGLCLGVSSIFLAFIGIIPILAIVFSGIALAKASERGGSGRTSAWIGLVLGIVYTLVYLSIYGHI
jgi:hypothetical protein